jgi:hypothetical protein
VLIGTSLISHDAAVLQAYDPLRDRQDARIVGDDRHDALAVARDVRQELCDLRAIGGVEASGGLIGEHDPRAMRDRPS